MPRRSRNLTHAAQRAAGVIAGWISEGCKRKRKADQLDIEFEVIDAFACYWSELQRKQAADVDNVRRELRRVRDELRALKASTAPDDRDPRP